MNLKLKTFLILFLIAYLIVRVPQEISKQTASKSLSNNKAIKRVEKEFIKEDLKQEKQVTSNLSEVTGDVVFPIYPAMNFNDKTKQDIYDIRKANVGNSPLYPKNYEPSDAVFGQIISSMPWRGKYAGPCKPASDNDISHGEALLSTIINNPNALLSPFSAMVSSSVDKNSDYCKINDDILFVPKSVKYIKSQNLLEIVYPINPVMTGKNQYGYRLWLMLSGINARDAGYNYVTLQSSNNAYFFDRIWNYYSKEYEKNVNIRTVVHRFADFIHLGTSCGLRGGCNNISPRQTALEFDITALPAEMNLKLWRKNPKSRESKADLNCKIIFE